MDSQSNSNEENNVNEYHAEILTAYHEAGHALAFYLAKREIIEVSIIPSDDCLGYVLPVKKDMNFSMDISKPKAFGSYITNCFISQSGHVAEQILTNKNAGGSESDIKNMTNLFFEEYHSQKTSDAFFEWLNSYIKDVLSTRLNWKRIELLAQELLIHKKIDGKRVWDIFAESNVLKELGFIIYPDARTSINNKG